MSRDRGCKVPNVLNVFGFSTLLELKAATSDFVGILRVGLGFEMEKIAKMVPVQLDSKESFIEVDENGNMENRVGI